MIFGLNVTSQSVTIQIVDDAGLPVTGLVAATFPALVYNRAGANADVAFPALSDLALITTAWAAGGVKERTGGYYRLDVPDAIFTAAGQVRVRGEATGKRVLCTPLDVAVVVNTLANLPAIPNGWLTAAGVAAAALNGKGDWNTVAPLDAAGTRAAVGLAFANLDTQLGAIDDFIDTEVGAIKAKTDSLTFDVAGVLSVNVRRVNDVVVLGAGTTLSPWGP